jgi:hypothetical protein
MLARGGCRWTVLVCALLLGALADSAGADTPPAPTCFYYVAGCDATYGTPGSSTLKTVEVDGEVTLDSGFNPDPPFGTPANPSCLDPGSLGTCVYSNVAWLFSKEIGFNFTPPLTILDGCTGSSISCKFKFSPRGIGNDGDVWQTLVAAHRIGTTQIKEKRGYAVYARPRWRWVNLNATGAVNYTAGLAYAVRSGTNPSFGSCVDASTVFATTSTTAYDCLKSSGSGPSGQSPSWRFPLPAGSSWKVLFNPIVRTEAGPAAIPAAQERWFSANLSVGQSDITQAVTPRPRGTLKAVIDTGGPTIQVGTNRLVTVTATAEGGFVENAGWEASLFTYTAGGALSLAYVSDEAKTLVPGESVVATGKMTAPSYVPAVPATSFTSRVRWRSPTSVSRDLFVDAPPVTVTVVKDPVPPPPPTTGGDGVPKPPIPSAATTARVTGRVADAPLTTYSGTWYSAPSCDATDATSKLIATVPVTTDGTGAGDASASPSPAPAPGDAVFGYSSLGGKRSARSACVTVPLAAAVEGLTAGGGAPLAGGLPPAPASAPVKKVALGFAKAALRAGRTATLKVKVAAAGKVELRQGKRRVAGPVPVKGGVAALKVRFAKAGKVKLTAVFTPAGAGPKVTQPITVTVGR